MIGRLIAGSSAIIRTSVLGSAGAAVCEPLSAPAVSTQIRMVSRKTFQRRRPNRNPRLRVTLLDTVPKLGLKGETVAVKRGFARNFLIPQGLANYSLEAKVVADDEIDSQPQEVLQETIEADQSQRVANFLAKHKLKMVRQSGNSWAINAEMLSQKCAKQFQLDVPSERIQLEAPLMTFGEHKVPVMVDDETPSELNVDVVRR
eukprot:m.37462 g.37462  ORF g.37462 m.37462 type:complete len:203 (-) comp7701_c0_seq1:1587-2195(-)